jgi:aspartyl-tRNA(Asn)/glutamyl-tRNA(Gln) amidotransferase subunit B
VLLSGQPVIQETRRFDDSIKETLPMRLKTDSVDYKYFTEPNLVPTRLGEAFIQSAIESCPEWAERRYERYLRDFGLSEYDATLLIASPDQSNYFDQLVNLKARRKWPRIGERRNQRLFEQKPNRTIAFPIERAVWPNCWS